jgi:hypothetical protein
VVLALRPRALAERVYGLWLAACLLECCRFNGCSAREPRAVRRAA